jgi:hypothetical protein
MNYEETFVGRKRDREVKPRKLTLDEEQKMLEDDLLAHYQVLISYLGFFSLSLTFLTISYEIYP